MTDMPATPDAPDKTTTATDDFIREILPAWLTQASLADIRMLRRRFAACNASRERLTVAKRHLTPPDSFAASLLGRELQGRLGLTVKLRQARWREVRRHFVVPPGGGLPIDEVIYKRMPALQRLMQNFQDGVSYYIGSALVEDDRQETTISDRLAEIAQLCRSVDAGARYQALLSRVFNVATQGQLAADKRNGLAMAAEIAALKGQLQRDDLECLRRLVDELPAEGPAAHGRVLLLRILDQPVGGALAVELRDARGQPSGVMLYLPDVSDQPLRRHASWEALGASLAAFLKDAEYRRHFMRLIALRQRPAFLSLLSQRLSDALPDLAPQGQAPEEEIFVSLAAQQVARIKDDARLLLVPTADADHAASEAHIEALEGVGLGILNLAGLFVPVVGELLFGQMVVQTLSEVYEGAEDWSQGHQHEALHHMLGLAETVVVAAVTIGATAAVARGFTRGRFVDELEPVELNSGARRLWSSDLGAYRVLPEPESLRLQDNGLYSDGQRYFWRHEGVTHEVQQIDGHATWRLRHPERDDAYGPVLEHNGECAWRVRGERPLEWQGAGYLLSRLWPASEGFDAPRVGRILRIAGVDEDALRGLLVENRPLPVALRDTLERDAVAEQLDVFFTRLAGDTDVAPDAQWLTWCREQLTHPVDGEAGMRVSLLRDALLWRRRLFEHFCRRYLPGDDLLALVQRDFPGLPDAYALDVLKTADSAQRQRMLEGSRLPLALAEQARAALQSARVTRMVEGLYLRDNHSDETLELVFAFLRRRQGWPQTLNLEVRDGSDAGPLLARLDPRPGQGRLVVLARRDGLLAPYDGQGRMLEIDIAPPKGIFEALVAVLEPVDAQRLGWAGEGGGARMRADVQAWLPQSRRELLALAGLREIKPWFKGAERLQDGRFGYALSGRGIIGNVTERIMRSRIRSLYPGFDDQQVTNYLEATRSVSLTPFSELLRQEHAYWRFDRAISRWEAELPHSFARNRRRFVCEELRRSWRMQGETLVGSNAEPIGMRLSLAHLEVGELPALPASTDFSHILELDLTGMRLQQMPGTFLGCFTRLRKLRLGNNALQSLPPGLSSLSEIRELHLQNNNLRMTGPAAFVLGRLRQLRVLDLSYNPLGLISLHLNQFSQLTDLNLRSCQLETLPPGLQWCAFLEVADLRGNRISSLPQVILDAAGRFRRTLLLEGNPLPEGVRQRMMLPDQLPDPVAEESIPGWSREHWTQALDTAPGGQLDLLWDQIRAEAGSTDFFDILDQLTQTSDFNLARADLQRRVGEVLEAMGSDSALRNEVFNLASSPRTCVDSVASCFSALEVRVLMARALQRHAPDEGLSARLDLARRLFRLDRVEKVARDDIAARLAKGESVDEIEVSLAYRTGLARRLELPGQPQTMQFELLSGVTEAHLDQAAATVRQAEASEELAEYVGERDFWREYLREENAQRFEGVEQQFWERLEALGAQQDSLEEGIYLQRMNQLSHERQAALDALFLTLTRQALAEQQAGRL